MKSFLSLVAGLALALPAATQARDQKIRRDLDGDGHFNTKRIESRGHYHGGYRGGGSRYYGNRYYGGSRYYGGGYGYGYPYGLGYGYGYGYPYYSSAYYAPGVVLSFGGRSSYNNERYADNLAVDVQRALKRRGYYRGSIDGDIGPGTRSAIRSYQHDRRLSVTGRIDRSLINSLDLD